MNFYDIYVILAFVVSLAVQLWMSIKSFIFYLYLYLFIKEICWWDHTQDIEFLSVTDFNTRDLSE